MMLADAIKYARCIEDGSMMNTGKIFCVKGKAYAYYKSKCVVMRTNEVIIEWNVQSEGQPGFGHSMKNTFFRKYFKPFDEEEWLTQKEMEI